MVVGLKDPHKQPVQTEQQDNRKQDLREPHRQGVQLGTELGACEQRHDYAGGQHEEGRERPKHDQDDPEQSRGQAEGLALLALLQQGR